jgi:IclR family KDG regulon transcriptional repressor
VSGVESRLPLHCTALGKLLLAMLPADVRRELLGELVLKRHTPHTIRTRRALLEELSRVGGSDLAICDEELELGQVMIAAPVRDERGDVRAALGLSAMTSRITADGLARALGPRMVSAAAQISARLGYRGPDEQARTVW